MDIKKIAFIVYRNNASCFSECVRYIKELYVPEGYSVDILPMENTKSVPLAYNAAMESSEAKYKIYLQDDTFILHRDLIPDILKIFNEDSSIGMIGMVGCRKLSVDRGGQQCWDMGRVYLDDGLSVVDWDSRDIQNENENCFFAEAIDGFFMATQYDLRWQEESADGRDYGVMHSLGMLETGKSIVIPWQEEPWCCHRQDDGEGTGNLREQLIGLAEAGAYDMVWSIIDVVRRLKDRECHAIAGLAEIYVLEKASCQGLSSEWWISHTWSEVYSCYNWVRFVLMRVAYQREDERIQQLKLMLEEGRIHKDAVLYFSSLIRPDKNNVSVGLCGKHHEEPLVSVILPVYNCAGFVGKTIESILDQTYQNMEIIIVDDASTDYTLELIRSYQDFRIKVISCEKNRNVVHSSNVGFKMAKGKYVALIGHDDLWKQDKLEKQIAFLEEHPSYSICFTRMDVIDDDLMICKESHLYQVFSETNRTAKAWIRKLFMEGNYFCAPSACIRKEVFDRVGYYRYALVQLQDYDLWLRLFLEGDVYIYPERLTCYRQFKDKKNLSVMRDEVRVRGVHEKQYICSRYIKELPGERFTDIFSGDMINADANGEKEILCEKALFLWRKGFYSGHYDLAELLEDEECRRILEENYQIDLIQFYKLNAQSVQFE